MFFNCNEFWNKVKTMARQIVTLNVVHLIQLHYEFYVETEEGPIMCFFFNLKLDFLFEGCKK